MRRKCLRRTRHFARAQIENLLAETRMRIGERFSICNAKIAEFTALMSQASGGFHLDSSANQSGGDLEPDAQTYIARRRQILIALWDGRDSDAKDNVAQIAQMKLDGASRHSSRHTLFDVANNGA